MIVAYVDGRPMPSSSRCLQSEAHTREGTPAKRERSCHAKSLSAKWAGRGPIACAAACVCTSEFECAYDEANCKPSCAEEHFATPNADGTAWVCAEAEMPGVVRAGGGMGGGAVFGLCVLMLGVGAGGMYALEAYRRRARGSASMGYQLGEVGDDGMLF